MQAIPKPCRTNKFRPAPDYRDHAAAVERHKMVAAVSLFAAAIFLTAVLLIVITLHMSQSLNPKGEWNQSDDVYFFVTGFVQTTVLEIYLHNVHDMNDFWFSGEFP
jgi:hypothetical protein